MKDPIVRRDDDLTDEIVCAALLVLVWFAFVLGAAALNKPKPTTPPPYDSKYEHPDNP